MFKLISLLLGCYCFISNAWTQTYQTEKEFVIEQIQTIVGTANFNGIILVKKGEEIIFEDTYGYAAIETYDLLKKTDQFVIGSISKQITAVLVMRAYAQQQLDLNDPIGKYLTTIQQPWSKTVTVHHLLIHKHGIKSLDEPLQFSPGSKFQYSQLGYSLLDQILENTSGKSFEQQAQQLFQDFGLTSTYHPNSKKYQNLVNGYEQNPFGDYKQMENSLENYPAAGSFISTAQDLTKWNELLHSGQLVDSTLLKKMTTNYATRNHPIAGVIQYGYGLLFKNGQEDKQIGTFGYTPGFASSSFFFPETNYSLVILENVTRSPDDFKEMFRIHTSIMEVLKKLR